MSTPCPRCGYANAEEEAACGLCGTLRIARSEDPFRLPVTEREAEPTARHAIRIPVGWLHLVIGLVLAGAFTLTPALRFMGWLFGSLFHETGHVVFAWFAGCPAWPVISLQGHAAAIHKPQSAVILVGVVLLLGIAAWQAARAKRWRGLAFGALAVWPIVAFLETPRDLGFLLSGHLGELVFAGVFLWRARTGEAIEKESERPLYACLGWFLVVRNVILCFGLAFLPAARAAYAANGSFGLTNDYVRVAEDVLHVPLASVAVFMLLVALAVVPLVLAATWAPRTVKLPPRRSPPPPVDTAFPDLPEPPSEPVRPRTIPRGKPRPIFTSQRAPRS